jgi:hypothetical protein
MKIRIFSSRPIMHKLNFFLFSDCYTRMKRGYKHYAYRDYKSVPSVEKCSEECFKSAYCKTFSYRLVGFKAISSQYKSSWGMRFFNPWLLTRTEQFGDQLRGMKRYGLS